jgi:acetyl-CoA carboxylase carboxyl transferase subunit beta
MAGASMNWFRSIKNPKLKQVKKTPNRLPTGLWKKCPKCGEIVQVVKLEKNHQVCPYCDHHYRLSSEDRIELLSDSDSFESYELNFESNNPLKFEDKKTYGERLGAAQDKTGLNDSVRAGRATSDGLPFSIAVMEFSFMGGSMGVACGEAITLAMDKAIESKIPCVVVAASGGARMQEGLLSLMQMAKTSASRSRLKEEGLPYITILTDPTTGGVAASFAMLGDVIMAEPHALIGFAGPRVIEQSIRQTLPEGFQRAEFLLEHGFVDRIVHRHQMREELAFFLKMFARHQ